MLVYDITNERSFENIKNWIRNIEEVEYTVAHLYMYLPLQVKKTIRCCHAVFILAFCAQQGFSKVVDTFV